MNKFLTSVLVLLALAFPSLAFAQNGIEARMFNSDVRVQRLFVPRLQAIGADTATAARTAGLEGVVAVGNLAAGADSFSVTTSIAGIPYPCRINLVLRDVTGLTATNPTCATVYVYGYDQFGAQQRATFSNVLELATQTSSIAFVSITQMDGSTCGGGNGHFILGQSTAVALPWRIRDVRDVLSICRHDMEDATGTPNTFCQTLTAITLPYSANYVNVGRTDNTIELRSIMPYADGDSYTITYRASAFPN